MSSRGRVLLAMSGGVDSSVAALLLLEEGYDVIGCFMRLGSPGETVEGLVEDIETNQACVRIGKQGCCSINDAADARQVAGQLGLSFYVCNFKRDFGRIIDYFVDEYNAGRTPNPCVRCNDWLKFGRLHDYARQLDADFIASGHYARVERGADGEPQLLRGIDHHKDQSYVLFGVPHDRLSQMLLPVGGLTKKRVREIALAGGIKVHGKPDSQEICFVPDQDYAGLVRRRTPDAVQPGAIVDERGDVIGEHPGHQHFTIGQRRGLRIAHTTPLYVLGKDPTSNTVTVGPQAALASQSCIASEVNWLVPPCEGPRVCTTKIRYNAEPVGASVEVIDGDRIRVKFDDDQLAVAPGQAVVCYDGDRVICGGWIDAAAPPR